MPRRAKQRGNPKDHVDDYRHEEAKRKNNPEVGLSNWEPKAKTPPRVKYKYDPHLDPHLQWAGKAEHPSFEVDTVSLHIHERVSTQAIVKAIKKNGERRTEQQLDLFADPQLPLDRAVEFYQHDVDWANRLILGDSLLVMNSLLQRELMAGRIQMIYVDPPYGVSYNSNFQPSIRQRDVKDGQDDSLTREPEQIKAYRDTWQLGIHSYLTYLRDRLLLCRELLAETGSIFVQISDVNVHHVRELMDEVFGAENFVALIMFAKSGGTTSEYLSAPNDFLIWYARERSSLKYRQLFKEKKAGPAGQSAYSRVELPDGTRRPMTKEEIVDPTCLPQGSCIYRLDNLTSQGYRQFTTVSFEFEGKAYHPGPERNWKTTVDGLRRLASCNRLQAHGNGLYYVRFLDDFPVFPISNDWDDTVIAGFASDKKYVVETSAKVVARCMLMTTDAGDLVFDPTCGSGTTAYVAEQWGRRWITCDTSRVALALARQHLLTATFDYYQLAHPEQGVDAGFVYETVPHITLKSIAQNAKIDEVSDKDPRRREKIERIIAEGAVNERVMMHHLCSGILHQAYSG